MNASDLIKQSGGCASREPVCKSVEWANEGEKVVIDLHFLRLSAGVVRDLLKKNDGDSDAHFVAGVLVNPDGTAAMTVEQAQELTLAANAAIVTAGLEVNGLSKRTKTEAKNA